MTMVNSKSTLKQVSLLGLLQAIAATQPPSKEMASNSKLKAIKEVLSASRPDVNITWTSIMHARTEAVAQGFVHFDNYIHTLTDSGKKELADLQAKNGCQSKKKMMAFA